MERERERAERATQRAADMGRTLDEERRAGAEAVHARENSLAAAQGTLQDLERKRDEEVAECVRCVALLDALAL